MHFKVESANLAIQDKINKKITFSLGKLSQAEIEKLQAESGMGSGPMMLKASQVFDLVFTKGSPELKAALITYGIHAGNA